jgi:O-antigen/teichoic acid export membrane protein
MDDPNRGEMRQVPPTDAPLEPELPTPRHGFVGRLAGARLLSTRLGWGVGDQVLSSLTNFALGVIVARSVSAEAFGQFALVFWTYLLLLNIGRAIGSYPLWVVASHVGEATWRPAMAGSAGASLLAGLTGVGFIVVGAAVGGQAGAFVALGIALPGLLLQDAYRLGMIADGRAHLSFGSDLTWTLSMAGLLGVVFVLGTPATVPLLLMLWGIGGSAGAVFAILACGVRPAPRRTRAWLQSNAHLIRGFALGGLAETVAMTAMQYLLAAVAGFVVVAAIRGSQLLLSPVTVAYQGVVTVMGPEASRSLRLQPGGLLRRMAGLAAALTALALVYGAVALMIPDDIGTAILGDSWGPARAILPLMVLAIVGLQIAGSAGLGLLVRGEASHLARLGLTTAPLTAALAVVGGGLAGSTGAAAGLACGYAASVVAYWWTFIRALRMPPPVSGGDGPPLADHERLSLPA